MITKFPLYAFFIIVSAIFSFSSPLKLYAQNENGEFEQQKKESAQQKKERDALSDTKGKKDKMNWELYSSESSIFNIRFPKDYRYRVYSMSMNDTFSVYYEEVIATLASETNPDSPKNYLVQMEQSFGSPLTATQMRDYLAEESDKYKDFARKNKGIIVSDDDVEHFGFLGKDIYLTYTDKLIDEKKKQALRIRVLYTDSAKIQLVISGDTNGMHSFYNDNFINSVRLTDGYGRGSKTKLANWARFTDANKLFTLVIPPKHPAYRPDTPRYKLSKRISSAHTYFYDPILKQKMYYNVYGYKMGTEISDKLVRKIFFSQHIAKYVSGAQEDSVKVNFSEKEGYQVASTELIIAPKPEVPYVDAILLRAYYKDGYIVVQEMSGSQGHALGDLSKTIMDALLFHPEKFTETSANDILEKNKAYKAKLEASAPAVPKIPEEKKKSDTPPKKPAGDKPDLGDLKPEKKIKAVEPPAAKPLETPTDKPEPKKE